MRYTPENIEILENNEVFVFGSNLRGLHGAGAAKKALEFGAEMGQGVGLYGNTYAIPTKDLNIETLHIKVVTKHVNKFINFAKNRQDLTFLVTKIGCGLAEYEVEQIAPLFKKAIGISNIVLPKEFTY